MIHVAKVLSAGVLGLFVASSCGIFGCAAARPPQDLVDARAAYQLAATSPGANRAQADVAEAKHSLDQAELAFQDDADSRATRDWSYIAARKAGSARAKANALTAVEENRGSKEELKKLAAAAHARDAAELSAAREQVSSERGARVAAERKTADALSKIAGMSVTETQRGLVLTLSGSVLFATNKSVLLPAAQARLGDAAKALAEEQRSIVVVGHTDSTGSDAANEALSLKRAEAVRAYLVTHGVSSQGTRVEAMGESQPVADNGTPEGRANNRRVEIILERATK